MKHPIQPIDQDHRFKKNNIVEYLLDHGGINLNDLAVVDFSDNDREQFAQLIGYSLSGYGSLSYVSNESYDTACKMAEGAGEKDARIESLQESLEITKKGLRMIVPEVFSIHPDDLK